MSGGRGLEKGRYLMGVVLGVVSWRAWSLPYVGGQGRDLDGAESTAGD